jgi:hypothetical protein
MHEASDLPGPNGTSAPDTTSPELDQTATA